MIFISAGVDPEVEVFWSKVVALGEGVTGGDGGENVVVDRACIEEGEEEIL